MAFPQIVGSAITTEASQGGDPHTVNLPAGIQSGDLLVMGVCPRGTSGATSTGWTRFDNPLTSSPNARVLWKIADGTEGATVSVSAAYNNIGAVVLRITGHDSVNPIEAAAWVNVDGGVAQSIDPAVLTPTGGAKDYLWLAFGGHEAQSTDYWLSGPVVPANYTEIARSAFIAQFARAIFGSRELNAASEDPGLMDFGSADFGKRALTLAIVPAAAPQNDILNVPALGSGVVLSAPVPTAQSNETLSIPQSSFGATLHAVSLVGQGNDSVAVPALPAGTITFVPSLTNQSNTSVSIPALASGTALFVPTLTGQGNDQLVVANLAPTSGLFSPSLVVQNNETLDIVALVSGTVLNPVALQASGVDVLAVPSLGPDTLTFVPALQGQGNQGVVIPLFVAGNAVSAPGLTAQGNESLALAAIASTSALFVPVLQSQNDQSLAVPVLASSGAIGGATFVDQGADSLVVSSVVSGALLFTPAFTTVDALQIPSIPAGTVLGPVALMDAVVGIISLQTLTSTVRLNPPSLEDAQLSSLRVQSPGLQGVELNPIPPNVPVELQDLVPGEVFNHFQNMQEILHETYEALQSGGVALPAHVLRFYDIEPRFEVGSEAKFLHQQWGFLSATYVQFGEDVQIGAPAALSRAFDGLVTTKKADAVVGTELGLVTVFSPPPARSYGWVLTRGRNLLPLTSDSTITQGDELGWSADGRLAEAQNGLVVGRYVGEEVILQGGTIKAGELLVDVQSSVGNKFIVDIASINASLTLIQSVADGQASSILNLQTSQNGAAAALQVEREVRVAGDAALAKSVESLGVSLEDKANAFLVVAKQAVVDGDSAVVSLLEQARAEFFNALVPFESAIATAQTELSTLAAAGQAVSKTLTGVEARISNDGINLFPDPNFGNDDGGWESLSPQHDFVSDVLAPPVFAKVVQFIANGAVNDSVVIIIPVTAGEKLFAEYHALKGAGVNVGATFGVVLEFLDAVDATVSFGTIFVGESQLSTTAWTPFKSTLTVPVGAVSAKLTLTNRETHTAGLLYLGAPRLFRFESGADVTATASAFTSLEARVTSAEGTITSQASAITALNAVVDLRNRTFVQTTAPTADNVGDLWFDSDDSFKPYRWNGSAWVAVQDLRAAKTFAQGTQPTATTVGDLWINTADNNRVKRWNGTSWVDLADARVAANASAISTLDTRVTTAEGNITSNASAVTAVQTQVNGGLDASGVLKPGVHSLASLLDRLAGNIQYAGGQSVESLKPAVAGADTTATATAFTSLSATVTTQGSQLTTVRAQWGVVVDVNNRITGALKLDASLTESTFDVLANKFRVFNGATDVPTFAAIGGSVFLNGIPLTQDVQADDGASLRAIGVGVGDQVAFHGVPVTFSKSWGTIPTILFPSGGKARHSAFSDAQEHVYKATNITLSGFTPSLLIRDPVGTDTPVTDSGAISATDGPTTRILKSATLPDKNDSYLFTYNVTVPAGEVVVVVFWTRFTATGAWTQRDSVVHNASGNGKTRFVVVVGLGAAAEFGLSTGLGSVTFTSVSYTTNSGALTTSATPAGSSGVPYFIIGNKETV